MTNHKEGAMSVESIDALAAAYEAAMARIDKVSGGLGPTLVDTIDPAAWASWDASGELAIVSDSVDLDGVDPLDASDASSEAA
jgi:hypothetical protein